MALASRTDVETILGCRLSAPERAQLALFLDGLTDEITATVGPIEADAGAEMTFRPSEDIAEIRVPTPLTDVTEVEVDGDASDVDIWSTDGLIRMVETIDAGAEVVVTYDTGEAVPAMVRLMVASKCAAAVRAARAAHAHLAQNPTGAVRSKTIGSTSVTYETGVEIAEYMATAGARFAQLTDDDRKRLRRRFGVQTTTARVG